MNLTTRLASLTLAGALGLNAALAVTVATPTQAAPAPGATWRSTLTINKTVIDSGENVRLTGRVTPGAAGITVKVQKRLEGTTRWVDEKTLRTKTGGTYSYRDNPATEGKRRYRVVVPRTAQHPQGVSPSVPLTIFRWQPLNELAVRSKSYTGSTSSVSINGVDYGPSFVGLTYGVEGFVDWNLDKRCTSLTARVGNGDGSDDLAQAAVQLVADGINSYAGTFALTQSQVRTVDLTGVFRLAFKWSSTNPETPNGSGAQAVLAEPMVRCSI